MILNILKIFVLTLISTTIASNLCDYKTCKENEVVCLEMIPKCLYISLKKIVFYLKFINWFLIKKDSSVLCKCARYCKKLQLSENNETLASSLTAIIDVLDENSELILNNTNLNEIAIVKQNGPACSPYTCLNGGSCYTSLTEFAKKDCSTPIDVNNDCLLLEKNKPICVNKYTNIDNV